MLDESVPERPSEEAGPPKRYYFENLKISLPQIKLSVFTSQKLPPDLKVATPHMKASQVGLRSKETNWMLQLNLTGCFSFVQ